MKMTQAFATHEAQVQLIVPEAESENNGVDPFEYYDVDELFEIVRIKKPPLSSAGTLIFYLRALIQASRFDSDLIYSRGVMPAFLANLRGHPSAVELHSTYDGRRFGKLRQVLLNWYMSREKSSHLIAITSSLKGHYENRFTWGDDILVAHDGADPVDNTSEPRDFDGHSFHIGYIGSLYPGKGMELISQMAVRFPAGHFHIVGGRSDDIEYWKKQMGNLDNLTFHGHVPQAKLDNYRLAFDVLIAPYQYSVKSGGGDDITDWMSPLKIFEYMAAGKAIVCSDLPVLQEILTDGYNAFLRDPRDVDEWVAALETLRDDSALRTQLGENAQNELFEKYTWEKRAARILEFLNQS